MDAPAIWQTIRTLETVRTRFTGLNVALIYNNDILLNIWTHKFSFLTHSKNTHMYITFL